MAASDFSHVFTQPISSIYILLFYYSIIKEYRVRKMWFIKVDSKNEWLLLSASFTVKFDLVFDLKLVNAFS